MVDKRLGYSLLSLRNRGPCLANNKLDSSAFFFKSVINSFSWYKGEIMGSLLLFKKMFNMDQYVFEFIWILNSSFGRLEISSYVLSQSCILNSFAETLVSQLHWLFSMFLRRTLYVLILSWINDFILVFNHGGFLSSHNSWGIKNIQNRFIKSKDFVIYAFILFCLYLPILKLLQHFRSWWCSY